MRFLDHHVKGLPLSEAPTHLDPTIAAQANDGTWRSEEQWPPADAQTLEGSLLPGTYEDDGRNQGSADSGFGPGGAGASVQATRGHGTWTFSPPLQHEAHIGGIPEATINVTPVAPRTNVVVNLYDVDVEGNATLISRGAALADAAGPKDVQLWPTDWIFEPGHRIGVLVSGANSEAFTHVPTRTTVSVLGGKVMLPFLTLERVSDLQGDPAPRLESYLERAPFAVAPATIESRTNPEFALPGPLQKSA
jgi:hypothetical protein